MLSPLKAIKDLEQEWHPLVKKINSYSQFEKIIRTQDHKKPNFQNLNKWTTQCLLSKNDPIEVLVNYIKEIQKSLNLKNTSKYFPSKRSILYNKPSYISEIIWWYFKLIKSFVSIYKDIYFPIRNFSEEDEVDISAKKDISIKCNKWRDLLVK